jgi:beta-lactamase regulating signal transducer with metallopeptidase domain
VIDLQPFVAFEELARISATVAVTGLWQGVALAAAAALSLRLVSRTTASARFLIWTAVLVGTALLPFLHLRVASGALSADHALRPPVLQLSAGWSLGIAALWLAFSVFRLAQLAAQGARLRSLWQAARPVSADTEIAALLATVLATVPLRHVELCLSSEVDRPSVIGFFSPRVLIPDWLFERLSAPELFQIVLHEVEHLRRGDDWLNLLQKLSLALFPLNPALVWIERRLCSERELACDDGVLRVTLAPRIYASCLTTLAERRMQHRAAFSLSLGALGANGSELARRVYRILDRQPGLSPARVRAVTAMLAVGLAGCAAELARSPQLVSFVAPAQSVESEAIASPESSVAGDGLVQPRLHGGIQTVAFRNGNPARMSLLKATLPTAPAPNFAPAATPRKVHFHAPRPGQQALSPTVAPLQMAATRQPATQRPAEAIVVMTSWTTTTTPTGTTAFAMTTVSEEGTVDGPPPAATRRTPTVSRGNRAPANAAAPVPLVHQVSPQYAAVPTDLGWLIVQL